MGAMRSPRGVQALVDDTGYRPDTPVEEGVARFVEWYLDYYGTEAGAR